jgi:hypothetical protein
MNLQNTRSVSPWLFQQRTKKSRLGDSRIEEFLASGTPQTTVFFQFARFFKAANSGSFLPKGSSLINGLYHGGIFR